VSRTKRDLADLEAWKRAPMPVDPFPIPSRIEQLLEALAKENPRKVGEGAGTYIQRLRALAGLPE
jgi:hypothetical protein